jgi:hypothetical protein
MPTLEFLANYSGEGFKAVKALQDSAKVYEFALAFGKPETTSYGSLGVFTWEGQVSAWLEGGSVNAVREMRISVSATKEVSFSEASVTVTA